MSVELPNIEESTKFNFITSIWIVPFIALLIAAWLAYQYYAQLGPEIRIVFPKNVGLKAGQSHIKYRDVPIGLVQKIELEEDGEGVVVVARMEKTAIPYLNEYSKFWIVKPEVGLTGVSGLDTLISGTYINMFTQKSENIQNDFIGLEYAYRNIGAGEYFVLNTSDGDSSVKVGTPIYLKNIKVGQVEYVVLSPDNSAIEIIIFVDKKYVPYIHTDSKFWIRSTLNAKFTHGSLDVNVAPLTDLIQGAIEFSTTGKDNTHTVDDIFAFKLYKNKNMININHIGERGKYMKQFMLHTDVSLSKLKKTALVKYYGFDVGNVEEIYLEYDKKSHQMNSKVMVKIDTSVFVDKKDNIHTGEENFYQAVKEGLRAQIIASDFITGSLYINLVFQPNDLNRTIYKEEQYMCLPTIQHKSGDLLASATNILNKINALPLDDILNSLNTMIKKSINPIENADKLFLDLQKSVENFNKMSNKKSFARMPDEVDKTLKELTRMLRTTKKVVKGYGSDALITKQLSHTLKVVTETSKEMQHFLKMLNRKPDSMIFGDK